ncbi:MAG: hypothetical protein K6E54_00780 [Bacteroidaceae bacterium]|nr:hypothetical protein [Bacteroidaceae bacterium]
MTEEVQDLTYDEEYQEYEDEELDTLETSDYDFTHEKDIDDIDENIDDEF